MSDSPAAAPDQFIHVVDDDEALEARYGLRVPVLCDDDSGAELDWPFDAGRVRGFCAGA